MCKAHCFWFVSCDPVERQVNGRFVLIETDPSTSLTCGFMVVYIFSFFFDMKRELITQLVKLCHPVSGK